MLNRLEMLRIFCVAAEAISFKEAAIKLGISPQAVTRAVRELERLQGELLFHRNTRNVQITAYGELLLATYIMLTNAVTAYVVSLTTPFTEREKKALQSV